MLITKLQKGLFTVFLFFSLFFVYPCAYGQTITGVVLDAETREPLTGAAIQQKETYNGTSTDKKGRFEIRLQANAPAVLIISFIGYQKKEVAVSETGRDQQILMQPETLIGNEIFVEDVRVEETAPVTQSTIERASIEQDNIGQDPVYTLEKLTPSILTHSDAGTRFANYGYMRLRGMDQTRINMTLNGIPLNDMIDQGVFFSNFNDFGNSIESVQVQRGVGTSTHGTASYAGSINFESRNITMDEPSAGLKLTGGAFNSYRLSSEVNTGSMNNFGLYSRFSETRSDGYRFHSGTESRSFFISGGYFGERDIVKVTAFTGRTKNELAYTPVPIDLIREEPRTNTLSENDEDDFAQQFLQLQYGRSLTDRLSFTGSLYYGAAGGDFPVGFTGADGEFVQQIFSLFNDHYGLQSSLQYIEDDKLEVSGGVHVYRFDRVNQESFAPESEVLTYDDDSRKDEISSFVKASWRTGNVELYGDLQLRAVWLELDPDRDFLTGQGVNPSDIDVPVRQWTFVSPKIGITYFMSERFNTYLSFGRSGREPTRQDILGSVNINPSNLPIVNDEESVKAEYVNDFEGGFRFSSFNIQGSVNGFFMKFTNEISPTGEFIPEGFVQVRENIAESYRTGIETEWQWRFHPKAGILGNATWMTTNIREFSPGGTAEVFNDVESVLSPNWLVNGTLTYSPARQLDVSFSGRYMGEAFLELTNREDLKMPSFFVADLGVDARISSAVSASVKLHNLFDKLYFTNGAPLDTDFDGRFDTPGFIVQPPRHVFAEIEIKI